MGERSSGRKAENQHFSYHFKLFNNLKDESEVELAKRELISLFGEVEEVSNFAISLSTGDFGRVPFPASNDANQRLEDAITFELPYGRVQGFKGRGKLESLELLVRRLAYTREIYVTVPARTEVHDSNLVRGVNLFVYEGRDVVVRAITSQFFLEKSGYVSKLSRNTDEIDANVQTLLAYVPKLAYRIPATETMAVGRRLEDWFAIREEPSLYLTHYMHPYKGKFHPKMARALINYVCPSNSGIVLDNFSGSGTTLVEAQRLGLDSVGVDINPLSSLMSQVKVQCVEIDLSVLRSSIVEYIESLKQHEIEMKLGSKGQQTLSSISPGNSHDIEGILASLPTRIRKELSTDQLRKVLLAKLVLDSKFGKLNGNKVHEFLLLGLSGAISDVSRRTKQDFNEVLESRLKHLWGRIYLARKLSSALGIKNGAGECLVGDTRDLLVLKTLGGSSRKLLDNSIDCVVNSPPYSTALDYIRNDLPQLSILGIAGDIKELEQDMMGNPNLKVYDNDLQKAIWGDSGLFAEVPDSGRSILKRMVEAGRGPEAGRVLKFWSDMKATLAEINRVLKPSARAAVVIGDNNIQLEKGSRKFVQVPNIAVLKDLGGAVGLSVVEVLSREIEKTMSGMIRSEAIIIYQKQPIR